MNDHLNLESLYTQARQALKAKDYDRASDLLRQILLIDEDYKDASRLLAQTVKLRRRRWYNDPRLWGTAAIAGLVIAGMWIVPHLQGIYASPPSATVLPTNSSLSTLTPTIIPTATETHLPEQTVVPLTWKRVSVGQEFPRDKVTAFAIDPKDPDVLYAGMKYAGIYKSIDGGLSWRPAHHGLGNAHVGSLLIDSQNPQILYAGTEGGIFKSEDGAENWAKIGAEIGGRVEVNIDNSVSYWNLPQDNYSGIYLLMDPQDSSHLYARDADNIYESNDQGKNWKRIYSSEVVCPGKIFAWAIHPVDGRTLFIVAGLDCVAGIYSSSDGGQTWTPRKLLDPLRNYEIEQYPEFASLSVGLDRQSNSYLHWGEGLIHGGSGIWKTLLEIAPPAAFDMSGSVYFYYDTYFYKFNLDEQQRFRLGKPEVGALTVIALSPHDPNTIYVAGDGIAVSKDGGQTWSKRSNGLGGMFVTLEAGGGSPPALYMVQVEECEAIRISPGKPDQPKEPGQPLYISNDGGQTWDLATDTGCYLIMDAKEPTLYRIGLVMTWDSKGNGIYWIWRSQDGGKSWTKVFLPEGGATLTAQGGLLYLYIGIGLWDDHWEYVSEDYGREWRTLKPPREPKLCYGSTLQFIDAYRTMTIDPSDGNHVFVIDNGALLESQDSCDTTEVFTAAPNTSMNSIAFDPNQAATIYAGTESGAYVSFDGGKTWNEINNGLLGATVVYSIVVDKESNVYAATPYGIFKLEGR